ncbi:methionyl-tRNA formyltransferase [Brevundimonas sp. 2R-24]|uniref:Methionyl-tRNA formyltransferase n=1 Tax=Peiella sedimenti TaxID=3061083 RepID=A0ABT8SPS8_9CAUL|nr:methionyl-tRNA formyltransferase [Caulobacteraceae bacterium XZ-24]
MRLVFMGAPEFAVPSLAALVSAGHEIAAVYTQPPRPRGRGQALRPTPVQAFAEGLGLEVRTPASMRHPAELEALRALGADAAVVVAYGQILPQAVLDAPRLGSFNVHGSLLPRWRGAAPIQRAIMAGDAETGVQIMRMTAGLDEGPVLLSERTPIRPNDTTGSLAQRLAQLGADLLPRALAAIERGGAAETPQVGEPAYAKKITTAEARLDFSRSAAELDRLVRGLSPAPGAWFEQETPQGLVRIKVLMSALGQGSGRPGTVLDGPALTVAAGEGAVRLITLQRPGGKPQAAEEFLRGFPLSPGTVLGSAAGPA